MLIPGSRGSAGVAALVCATALLLAGAFLAFGAKDPETDRLLERMEAARRAGPDGPDASDLAKEADALCKALKERKGIPGIPAAVRFLDETAAPVPPAEEPPGGARLRGLFDGEAVRLDWDATGGSPAAGYRIELLGDGAEVLSSRKVDGDARSWRGDPLDSLTGSRTYRVTAIAGDGTVAGGEQKTRVPFEMDFEVEFLGADPDGRGRFRVLWDRADGRVAEVFAVETGGGIGGAVPAAEDRPALDLGTGWKFAGFAGRREIAEREVEVPRFLPNGSLLRDPDTGKVVFENRTARVPRVEIGAEVVLPDDGAGGPRWLPKAKD
jgi:hypothetical protein